MASLGIALGELKTKFTAAQIFLCSLQFLRSAIMALSLAALIQVVGRMGNSLI